MKIIVLIIVSLTAFNVSGQVTIVSKNNFDFARGAYVRKSTDPAGLKSVDQIIQPQKTMASASESIALLFPPKEGILIFKSKDLNAANVVGKLSETSLVKIDTIYHNQVYRGLAAADNFSFDICYALNINGVKYYTDFRPHDFIPFKYKIEDRGQLLLLAAQSTGYDMYADNGYPNHFRVVVFARAGDAQRMFFASNILPFDYGDEFWETEENLKTNYDARKKEFHFEIIGMSSYKAIWNGKELIAE